MKPKSLLWTALVVLALSLLSVATISAQGGQATLVVINYVGVPLTFTLDGQAYSVPGTEAAPTGGVVTFTLGPGQHNYSGEVPGGPGANGQVDLAAGQTYVIGARVDHIPEVISKEGVVLTPARDELVFFQASLTPGVPTATPTLAPLQPLPAGEGALVVTNYIGDELVVNLNGAVVRVPPGGRQQVNFTPGTVTYSASAGIPGTNGTVEVTAGQYTQLAFTLQILNATPTPMSTPKAGETVATPVTPKMYVAISVLSGPQVPPPAVTTPEATAVPAATQPAAGATEGPPAGMADLTISNYIGQTLTFTINGVAYQMVANSELTITLPPGDHPFTAALPKATYNGSVVLDAGATRHIGVTSNPSYDAVYVNIQ